jgi:hypothetical protein
MNPTAPHTIRTQSPIRAWYLSTFCGKKVFTKICQPTLCICGVILYQQSWILINSDQGPAVLNLF